jgi:ABC-type multidrug transport system fused ATPase/permease subunit
MDDLQKEISELKQFVADLKADRVETKAKEKREAWIKYVSLTVVIIAVAAAMAAQWAGKFSGAVVMNQAWASDQWSFYQAKSLKQHLDESIQSLTAVQGNNQQAADLQKKLAERAARYEKEKADIKAKAEGFENARDIARSHGGKMASVISLFSVSIAMASLCIVTKKKPLWFIAMAMGVLAIAQFLGACW